jgi:hypothetical protein
MSPVKLRRHDTNYPAYKHNASLFKRKLEELTNSRSFKAISSKTGNRKATEASYRVNYRTALPGEAHTFTEPLITPRAGEMTTCVLGEQSKEKEETVHLFNNTVRSSIKICQQIQQNNWCRDLNPALLLRRHLTNDRRVKASNTFVCTLFVPEQDTRILLSTCAVLELLLLPTNIAELDFPDMRQHNLNIVNEWV